LFTTRTSNELFEPQGVKNNYDQPQGPTAQLSLCFYTFPPRGIFECFG
jgi:hypothetical protein